MLDEEQNRARSEKEIFLEAIEIDEGHSRSQYLDDVCGVDTVLRAEIESLLEASESSAASLVDASLEDLILDERKAIARAIAHEYKYTIELDVEARSFGNYELLEELGRGSMGVVYRARQLNLKRDVAIKIFLGSSFALPEQRKRFQLEAESAAQLVHPNVVPVYEVGVYEGNYFYSMALHGGGTLGGRIAQRAYSERESVELTLTVTRAVSFAHQKGIIHRDLKPDNILLDDAGQPHVSDFGLACYLDRSDNLTLTGQIMGTPQYMAPEVASGEPGKYSVLSDIYGIGAILYQLLTGAPPFRAQSILATLQMVREKLPTSPRKLNAAVDRDLETIVLKCLEKQPEKRYQSAEALALDLDAWLGGEPIMARQQTPSERLKTWTRRHLLHAALASIGGLLIFLLVIGGSLLGLRQGALRQESIHTQEIEKEAHADAERLKERAFQQPATSRRHEYDASMRYLERTNRFRDVEKFVSEGLLTAWVPQGDETDVRGWEWFYLLGELCQLGKVFSTKSAVNSLEFSPHGQSVLYSDHDGTAACNSLTGELMQRWQDKEGHLFSQFSPDGQLIATLSDSGRITFWQPGDAAPLASLPAEHAYRSFAWAPDGLRLATLDATGELCIWRYSKQIQSCEIIENINVQVEWLEQISWSPSGQHIAGIGDSNDVLVWEVENINEAPARYRGHLGKVTCMDWPSSGALLATGCQGGMVCVWRVSSGQLLFSWDECAPAAVNDIAWNPNGGALAYTSEGVDDVMRVDLNASEVTRLKWDGHEPTSIAWSADAYTIAIGEAAGGGRLVRYNLPPSSIVAMECPGALTSVRWSQDDARIDCLSEHGEVFIIRWLEGKHHLTHQIKHFSRKTAFAWSPTKGGIAVERKGKFGNENINVRMYGVGLAGSRGQLPVELESLRALAWTKHDHLYACDKDGKVVGWDLLTSDELVEFEAPTVMPYANFRALSLSPDSRMVLASGDLGRVTLWDAETGEIIFDKLEPGDGGREYIHAWSPNSDAFAIGSSSGSVVIWSIEAGAPIESIHANQEGVRAIAWNPSGDRLLTGGSRGEIRLWDVQSGELVLSLEGHEGAVNDLAWGPGGSRFASVGDDGRLIIWDATAGMLLAASLYGGEGRP
ncbi:protein kinase domain-containing protein [Cerasicoccus frondis]|uniref:protein kinase domain-containing protein n=1 Tax=Cerasicoccus frondis TaxID=490090 RepID=UPI002852780D|nr:protein kinase [Cerasicoccus frondis]